VPHRLLNGTWVCAVLKAMGRLLRHTTAMDLLHHGVDLSVIALWLGHECIQTTHAYLHASLQLKEQALAKTTSFTSPNGRYRPTDPLLAFLQSL
jgi:integrase/recombinase XerD